MKLRAADIDIEPPAGPVRRLIDSTIGRAIRFGRPATRSTAQRHVFHYENVLGTSFELHVVAEHAAQAQRAEAEALAEADRLEVVLSGWSATSELSRWLATFGVDAPVSPDLANVLAMAEHWRVITGGAFDPAAQEVAERLRDPSRAKAGEVRGPSWCVDRTAGTARHLTRHAVSVDAIAKGYIVSAAAQRARAVPGVREVLLNIGGDIQHLGAAPVDAGIANPAAPAENAAPMAIVRIWNAALATSGGYRRSIEVGGRRVSHIVDPRTKLPADRIASASVFAPDCATADALSTAFSVMAPKESVALADAERGVGCLIVAHDGTITTNAAWDACAAQSPPTTTPRRHFP